MDAPFLKWVLFNAFVLAMLALDLGVFHRKAHVVKIKEALVWSAIWIALALAYNLFVYWWRGPGAALEFFTGYLIEKSLSVDNIFVFVLLFSFFRVPQEYQHRVLFWGILGALIMRGILIAVGVALITSFSWIIYIFGAFLVATGLRMAVQKEQNVHIENNPLVKIVRRIMPVTNNYHGQRFFVLLEGRRMATPLFMVLLTVEFTDLIFAVDSIPAIFAVTQDPFIVYTSNVFAILGLRALYFALAGVVHKFHYLKLGLGIVLVFVGVKMLLAHTAWKIPTGISLAVVGGIIAASVIASLVRPLRDS
ncbi:TerC family protein [candidate division KSB1 bacterium]|nr:MAG: TerC family protein [candidate division KSB1 bacterium]